MSSQYESLLGREEADWIRVMDLQPAADSSPIVCNLRQVRLAHHPRYEALSYVWGDPMPRSTITCNEQTCEIGPSLHAALQRLRDPVRIKTLWIDAICINQTNDEEKSQQVRLMRLIYMQASQVNVWLGPQEANSELAFPLMDQLYKHHSTLTTERGRFMMISDPELVRYLEKWSLDTSKNEAAYTALWTLTTRSWFKRTWVIQEVALASDPRVLCGDKETTWHQFEFALGFFEGSGLLGTMRKTAFTAGGINRRTDISTIRNQLEQRSKPTLLDCVIQNRLADATNPRDKVFAFCGLAKDAGPDGLQINIDYSRSVSDVYLDFWVSIISKHENLNHLGLAVNRIDTAGSEGLPTWVPDWTMPHPEDTLMHLEMRLMLPPLHTFFSASGATKYHVRLSADRKRLIVPAIQVDTIEDLGPIRAEDSLNARECGSEESAPFSRKLTKRWMAAAGVSCHKKYPFTSEAAIDAYWQTSYGGHVIVSYENARNAFYWSQNLEKWPKTTKALIAYKVLTNSEDRNMPSMMAWKALNQMQYYRRVGRTTKGYMVRVSSRGRPGDTIFILQGACVPFVLRPNDDGWELISEAYVHGIMRGEAHDDSLYKSIELV
jgi:predicted nucleic acid-binding protein